jgi:mRNA interferase MazF
VVGKQRPVVILQTDFLTDVGHPTCIVLPITSKKQEPNLLRFPIQNPALKRENNYILIDQIRTIDSGARLKQRIGSLSLSDLKSVEILVKQVLALQ